jgi:hypothetical protein
MVGELPSVRLSASVSHGTRQTMSPFKSQNITHQTKKPRSINPSSLQPSDGFLFRDKEASTMATEDTSTTANMPNPEQTSVAATTAAMRIDQAAVVAPATNGTHQGQNDGVRNDQNDKYSLSSQEGIRPHGTSVVTPLEPPKVVEEESGGGDDRAITPNGVRSQTRSVLETTRIEAGG